CRSRKKSKSRPPDRPDKTYKAGSLKATPLFVATCESVAWMITVDTGSMVGVGLRPAPTITCSWLRQRGGVTEPRSLFAAGYTPLHPHNKQGRKMCAPAVNPPVVGAGLRPAPTITCSWLRQRGGLQSREVYSRRVIHRLIHTINKGARCAPLRLTHPAVRAGPRPAPTHDCQSLRR